MSYSVNYDQEHDCLIGAFKGELNRQEIKAYVQEIVQKAITASVS